MNLPSLRTPGPYRIWRRALLMLLLAMFYHLCGTLLFFIAVGQFFITLLWDAPNARLCSFARSLGSYIRQIAHFLAFASDELPFPFSDWPPAE